MCLFVWENPIYVGQGNPGWGASCSQMSTFSTDICTRWANTSLTDADAAGGASTLWMRIMRVDGPEQDRWANVSPNIHTHTGGAGKGTIRLKRSWKWAVRLLQQPCQPLLYPKVEKVGLNTEYESTPDMSTKPPSMFKCQWLTTLQKMNKLFDLFIKCCQEIIFVPKNLFTTLFYLPCL